MFAIFESHASVGPGPLRTFMYLQRKISEGVGSVLKLLGGIKYEQMASESFTIYRSCNSMKGLAGHQHTGLKFSQWTHL